MFKPGFYYVGDPGYILHNDDLRMLFSELMHGGIKPGFKELVISRKVSNGVVVCDKYWASPTQHKHGTLFDQKGKGYGFDWGCFGVVPWEWIELPDSYNEHKIEFSKPFECFANDDSITIGHLHFTFNPK